MIVYTRENLVLLQYASNTCFTSVVDQFPADVELDLAAGVWRYQGAAYPIGTKMRYCDWGCRYGPIGVYDRTQTSHLDFMVHHAAEATREPFPMAGPYAD